MSLAMHTSSPGNETIARAALARYALETAGLVALPGNSAVYRVDTAGGIPYRLKIHAAEPAERIRARLLWLAALGEATGLAVQAPVPDRAGQIVTLVDGNACSLQRWVDGEPPGRDFTAEEAYRLGGLIARLHAHSATWAPPPEVFSALPLYTPADLEAHVAALRAGVEIGALTADDFATVEAAGRFVRETLRAVPHDRDRWGPVHGDLHHDNILLHGDEMRPIDFDGLHIAPYAYDLGTILYHILHQQVAVRWALVEGYEAARVLGMPGELWPEACVVWAAIDNLAFQVTLPSQLGTPLLARNLRWLAREFCPRLLKAQAFVLV